MLLPLCRIVDQIVRPSNSETVSQRKPKEKDWQGHYCCVALFRNSSQPKEEWKRLWLAKLSFYSFPKHEKRKKEWIVKIYRGVSSTDTVYSEHCMSYDYINLIPKLQRVKCCHQFLHEIQLDTCVSVTHQKRLLSH